MDAVKASPPTGVVRLVADEGALEPLVLGLFVWIPLEDVFRKLFGAPLGIHLVRDAFVVATLVATLRAYPGRSADLIPGSLRSLLTWGLLLYCVWSFHPALVSPLIPLSGIRLTFLAAPLFLVGAHFAQDEARLKKLLWTLVIIGCLTAALGTMQALVDPDFFNPPVDERPSEWLVGIVRGDVQFVTGPFLAQYRYLIMLLNASAAALCLFFVSSRRHRLLAAACAFPMGVGLIASGARNGPLALAVLFGGPALLALARKPRWETLRGRAVAAAIVAAVASSLAVAMSERLSEIARFYFESLFAEQAEGLKWRLQVNLDFLYFGAETWLFGHGTGAASLGVQYLLSGYEPVLEGGYSSLVWELGGLGLLFYALLAGHLSWIFVRTKATQVSRLAEALALSFAPVVLMELWFLNLLALSLQQHLIAIPLWFFAGATWALGDRATQVKDSHASRPDHAPGAA